LATPLNGLLGRLDHNGLQSIAICFTTLHPWATASRFIERIEIFLKPSKIPVMLEEKTALGLLLERARERLPGLKQEQFASDLAAIARQKGWTGFSTGSVSIKIKDERLYQHKKYPQYKFVMKAYAEAHGIQFNDVLAETNTLLSKNASTDNHFGIWQFLTLGVSRHKKNDTKPSNSLRRALFLFDNKKVSSIGVTSSWAGEYNVRDEFTYVRIVEPDENIEMFAILQRPTRRLENVPRYQRGVCLSVAFGNFDYHRPIAGGRCVLRRLDLLTDKYQQDSSLWASNLRTAYCGYASPSQLRKARLSFAQYQRRTPQQKETQEQFWFLGELAKMLNEDISKENFGSRIFLRY
jgi:hypothetical protein